MITQPDASSAESSAYTVERVFKVRLAGDAVTMRIAALLLVARGQPDGQATPKIDAQRELPVDVKVETELTAVSNGEVRHHLRVAPDLGSGFQCERLVDGQVVDEGAGRLQRTRSARPRPGGVHHHAGAVFVVLVEVTVDVVHQHQDHDRAPWKITADLQSAVVD